jgi:hypothetical protein
VRTDELFSDLRRRIPDPGDGRFGEDDLAGLPEPAARWFRASIAPGTPHATAADLRMTGSIRIGRWVPMKARELVAPLAGFVWAARVAGVIVGSDHYLADPAPGGAGASGSGASGSGAMQWRLGGVVPFVRAAGPDVSRSAAGRAAAEGVWVPTALLPASGVRWEAPGEEHLVASWRLGDVDLDLHVHLDPATGLARRIVFDRWGDPERTGAFGVHPFGVEVTGHRTFGGLTVAAEGAAGWYPGTDRWSTGEFFRYRITALDALPPRRPPTGGDTFAP